MREGLDTENGRQCFFRRHYGSRVPRPKPTFSKTTIGAGGHRMPWIFGRGPREQVLAMLSARPKLSPTEILEGLYGSTTNRHAKIRLILRALRDAGLVVVQRDPRGRKMAGFNPKHELYKQMLSLGQAFCQLGDVTLAEMALTKPKINGRKTKLKWAEIKTVFRK